MHVKISQLMELYPHKTVMVSLKELQSRLQVPRNDLIMEALNLSIPIFEASNPRSSVPFCLVTQDDALRLSKAFTQEQSVAA